MKQIEKAFSGNSVNVVYLCSDEYVSILAVSLTSLISNCSKESKYDICILDNGVNQFDKVTITKYAYGRNNVSIRFFNIVPYFSNKTKYMKETYIRFFVPWFLTKYDKVLCLGADTILNCDVADVYKVDVSNVCVCSNMIKVDDMSYNDKTGLLSKGSLLKEFIDVDTMIMNLVQIRDNYTYSGICEELHASKLKETEFLTKLFINKTRNIKNDDLMIMVPTLARIGTIESYNTFVNTKYHIFHYFGNKKPWSNPSSFCAATWWYYARTTTFYEEILKRTCMNANDTRSWLRKIIDFLLPRNTKRREAVKFIVRPASHLKNRKASDEVLIDEDITDD